MWNNILKMCDEMKEQGNTSYITLKVLFLSSPINAHLSVQLDDKNLLFPVVMGALNSPFKNQILFRP